MLENSFETVSQYVSLAGLELAVFILWSSELGPMGMSTQLAANLAHLN